MKNRFCAALAVAVLAISAFTGCAASAQLETPAIPDTRSLIQNGQASAVTVAPAVPAATITKEEAIAIALKDAGLTESQVNRLKTELDYEHGRAEYEVDFHFDNWEYDYEIDAETGRIISSDKDQED